MRIRIRDKLLICFALLVALSAVVEGLGYWMTQEYLTNQIQSEQKDKAQTAADTIENFISENENSLSSVARVYVDDLAKQQNNVENIIPYEINRHTYLRNISILSLAGRQLLVYSRSGKVPTDQLDYEILSQPFTNAAKGTTDISRVYYLESQQGPHIDIYSPIYKNKGTIIGVVKYQINLTNIWDVIAKIKKGTTGFAYVVDNQGRLLVHPNLDYVLTRPLLKNRAIINDALTNPKASDTKLYQYTNETGTTVVAKAVSIPQFNWLVVFEQSVNEAFSVANSLRNLFVSTVVASLLLLLLFALFISRNLTRALQILQRGTEQIAKGDLNTKLNIHSGDEIESLGMSFNSMAYSMRAAFSTLEEQKKRLETTAKLLLRRDLDIRSINEELEKEKKVILAEKNKLEVVLTGISDAVIGVDVNGKIETFNSAAEEMLEFSADEAVGQSIDSIIRVIQENATVPFSEVFPSQQSQDETGDGASVSLRGKKHDIQAKVSIGRITQGASSTLDYIVTLHDVTNEKQLESMKLDFVSMAAHELRTPLTSIKGYLSVFLNENKDKFNEEQKLFLDRIYIATQQLMVLVESLLSVARIERGAFTINVAPIDWVPIIQQVVDEQAERAHDKNITLTFKKPDDSIPQVYADKLRIPEVLTNLLANAISYTHDNGSVTVSLEIKDKKIITHITDTGEGIPPEAQKYLFTKFFRVAGKLAQGSKGTGLGLYICKSIVEMHKGEIWVESEVGKGSVFSFSLPTENLIITNDTEHASA